MEIVAEDKTAILNRLRRANGQLGAVIRMIEEDRDCSEVVTQLAACAKALDRAGFTIMVCGVQSCMKSDQPDQERSERIKELERLFLSLA